MMCHEKDKVIFQAEYLYESYDILDRTLLTKISEDELSQTIELSTDGGQN